MTFLIAKGFPFRGWDVVGLLLLLLLLPMVESFHSSDIGTTKRQWMMHPLYASSPSSSSSSSCATNDNRRRQLLTSSLGVGCLLLPSQPSRAADDKEELTPTTSMLKGTIALAPGVDDALATSYESGALYITCRPDKPDNVPGAILSGTRGKPPPVLAARLENPRFPLGFELQSPRDLTPEGASDGTVSSTPILDPSQFWWNRDDLIVSARWDNDGVAATRSPEDLVGRAIWKHGDATVQVLLTGRGSFGKFATGSSGSKK